MSVANSFSVALLASIALTTVAHGDTYRKLEQVLMDAHSLLLQKLLETANENVTLIGARCERLSAIIRHSTIPPNAQLLQLQLKVMMIIHAIHLFTRLSIFALVYLLTCHSHIHIIYLVFYLLVHLSCLCAHLIIHSGPFYSPIVR